MSKQRLPLRHYIILYRNDLKWAWQRYGYKTRKHRAQIAAERDDFDAYNESGMCWTDWHHNGGRDQ